MKVIHLRHILKTTGSLFAIILVLLGFNNISYAENSESSAKDTFPLTVRLTGIGRISSLWNNGKPRLIDNLGACGMASSIVEDIRNRDQNALIAISGVENMRRLSKSGGIEAELDFGVTGDGSIHIGVKNKSSIHVNTHSAKRTGVIDDDEGFLLLSSARTKSTTDESKKTFSIVSRFRQTSKLDLEFSDSGSIHIKTVSEQRPLVVSEVADESLRAAVVHNKNEILTFAYDTNGKPLSTYGKDGVFKTSFPNDAKLLDYRLHMGETNKDLQTSKPYLTLLFGVSNTTYNSMYENLSIKIIDLESGSEIEAFDNKSYNFSTGPVASAQIDVRDNTIWVFSQFKEPKGTEFIAYGIMAINISGELSDYNGDGRVVKFDSKFKNFKMNDATVDGLRRFVIVGSIGDDLAAASIKIGGDGEPKYDAQINQNWGDSGVYKTRSFSSDLQTVESDSAFALNVVPLVRPEGEVLIAGSGSFNKPCER